VRGESWRDLYRLFLHRYLSGIIGRMDGHYITRRANLRKLSVADLRPTCPRTGAIHHLPYAP
jgi:hypothetical protein